MSNHIAKAGGALGRRLGSVAAIVGSVFFATATFAQDAESVGQMQDVIEQQQTQIEAQQEQLKRLQQALEEQADLLRELQSQVISLGSDEVEEEVVPSDGEPTVEPRAETAQAVPESRGLVSQRDKHDLESPTASNVTFFDSSASGMIPGDETLIAVSGLVEFQMFHDTVGLNNNRFDTATIPVDGGPSQTKFNVNPSQFAFTTATKAGSGRLNTWLSIDLNGSNVSPEPRLRIAFAEYVNYETGFAVLGGQTYSTTLDLRAVPETLDFALPAGLWQLRQPLLRVSKAMGDSFTTEISIETPENVVYTDAVKRTRWPDISAAGTWLIGGEHVKHFRLAGIVRDLNAEGADGSRDSAVGWALSGSMKLGLPFLGPRDNLKLTAHVGDGYGTQLKGGPVEGVFNAATSQLETIGNVGSYGGLQHFWSDQFRSNFVYGHVEVDNPGIVAGDTLKNTTYFALNYIWSPFPTTTLGVEYLWGRRRDENGASGTSNRFLLSSKFQF